MKNKKVIPPEDKHKAVPSKVDPKPEQNAQPPQEASSQQSSAPVQNAIMAHEKPLPVLLLDTALDFGHVQQEIVALATHLQSLGFAVLLACPQGSALFSKVQKCQAQGIECLALAHKGNNVAVGLGLAIRLLWRFKKKTPLCIHSFSPVCLPLVHRLMQWRLKGATLAFYSAFEAPQSSTTTAKSASITKTSKNTKVSGISETEDTQKTIEKTPSATPEPATQTFSAQWAKYLACLDKIIVPSSYIRSAWAQTGIEVSKLKVIRTALPAVEAPSTPATTVTQVVEKTATDVASSAQQAQQAQQNHRFVFVVATNFVENSCLDVLFGAMLELEKTDFPKPWEVRVVGEGPDFATYMQRAEDLGIASRLALLSTLHYDFPLQATLPHGHALILPQLGPQGNMHACMHAWTLGLPIIATHIAEYTELMEVAARITRGSKGGITAIAPQEAKALAAAMHTIMGDAQRFSELAKESHAMRNYALMTRLQDTYMDVYKSGIASFGWVLPQKKK